MKLSDRTLEGLAKIVVGDAPHFPYRGSSYITNFFNRCGFPFVHDGSTRPRWTMDRLAELNIGTSQSIDLPSDDICTIISELFDPDDYEDHNKRMKNLGRNAPEDQVCIPEALAALNIVLARHGLVAYLDGASRGYVRSTGTGVTNTLHSQQSRPLSADEIAQRQRISHFLNNASEDEFIERVLVPLFQRLDFKRVSTTGHSDKSLEFGKDLWMKYRLPTGHWIYFAVQVKKDKIDSNNASGKKNVANVLTQAKMAIDHPIHDPEINRKVLLDHIYLISAGDITKQARSWLVEQLDQEQRRHIIFMDRDELLDHSARIMLDLRIDEPPKTISDDIVF